MPNLSTNLAGAGAIRATTITAATVEATSQFLAPNGTAAAPGYAFKARTSDGLFNEVSRLAISFGGSDKAYWGSLNHNYQAVSVTGTMSASVYNGLPMPQRAITATDTIAAADFSILASSAAGAVIVNLPTAASVSGRVFVVRKTNTSVNAVTIDPSGAETIDGAATLVVADSSAVMFQSDGTTWHLLARE